VVVLATEVEAAKGLEEEFCRRVWRCLEVEVVLLAERSGQRRAVALAV